MLVDSLGLGTSHGWWWFINLTNSIYPVPLTRCWAPSEGLGDERQPVPARSPQAVGRPARGAEEGGGGGRAGNGWRAADGTRAGAGSGASLQVGITCDGAWVGKGEDNVYG